MKKIHEILAACFVFAIILVGCETSSISEEDLIDVNAKTKKQSSNYTFDLTQDCSGSTVNLIAGQNMIVGTVSVTENLDNYIITYSITEPEWCLAETHLDVEQSPNDFPLTQNGNPKNGQFEYSSSHDCATSYSYTVPQSEGTYIAAHAVVTCKPNTVEEFSTTLPDTVEACAIAKGNDAGGDGYFDITINNTILAGDYNGWCADVDRTLNAGTCFSASVYSAYETLPTGIFEKPENFDLVNWIINQNFIGQESPNGGVYTFGDVQWAIWELIDNGNCVRCSYLGDDWSKERGQEIVTAALTNGENYTPKCGELMSVILIPENNLQPLIIQIPLPCNECEETAWADGCDFPGNNWATYFQYSAEE